VSLPLAVVHEASADFVTATDLADRVLVESVDWLDDDQLVHQRTWLRESGGTSLTWTAIKDLARAAGISVMGFFDGARAEPDALAARRAILYLRTTFPELPAIVLIRDQDDQPERRIGLEQARRHQDSRFPIVVGLAIVERESWVISGFDPVNASEEARLAVERQKLGFDPRTRGHELTACKNDNAHRSPKRVLRALCGDDRDREQLCWKETPLATLRERGGENGMRSFLDEVRQKLACLIGHVS
jgi:hypothetical protein